MGVGLRIYLFHTLNIHNRVQILHSSLDSSNPKIISNQVETLFLIDESQSLILQVPMKPLKLIDDPDGNPALTLGSHLFSPFGKLMSSSNPKLCYVKGNDIGSEAKIVKIKLKIHQKSLEDVIIISVVIIYMKTQTSVWNKKVHASFRKVVSFDLLFLGLGIPIGAGILALILSL